VSTISGGDKLEQYLRETSRKVSNAGTARVGFLEDATYPDGTSVATVAAIQNFGAPSQGAPPRPFFTNMVRRYRGTWPSDLARLLKANDMDARKALTIEGMKIVGEIQESIIDTLAPALSPVTLMLRKMRADDPSLEVTAATVGEAARRVDAGMSVGGISTKPLVDTGHLLASVDSEVV
jgi:hypothetical protein